MLKFTGLSFDSEFGKYLGDVQPYKPKTMSSEKEKIKEFKPAHEIPLKVQQHLKKILGLDDFQHPFLDRMNAVEDKLDRIIQTFEKKGIISPSVVIIDNAEFIRLFQITGKTAQNWRDEGIIEYSQVKGKIYYTLQDIEKLLKNGRN